MDESLCVPYRCVRRMYTHLCAIDHCRQLVAVALTWLLCSVATKVLCGAITSETDAERIILRNLPWLL